MKSKLFLIFIFVLFSCSYTLAEGTVFENTNSRLSNLQHQKFVAKLYPPNFVTLGEDATFKVFTEPNAKVKFSVEYSSINTKIYNDIANDKGVAVFTIPIENDAELAGKSIAIEAIVTSSKNPAITNKAIIQTETGNKSGSNRIYIADKEAAKGFMLSPMQAMNSVMMNLNYSDNSDFNPYKEQMYDDNTPIYIRNMRDAQDNVR